MISADKDTPNKDLKKTSYLNYFIILMFGFLSVFGCCLYSGSYAFA